jgi:hypothetical protein
VNYNGGQLEGYIDANGGYLDLGIGDRLIGKIVPITTPVPEPSSWALM